jgi:hypothetical protein
MLTTYNLIRSLIYEAASRHDKDPLFISFLDSLQLIIDAVPLMTQRDAITGKGWTHFDVIDGPIPKLHVSGHNPIRPPA